MADQFVETQHLGFLVKYPDHNLLTIPGRHRRYAEINRSSRNFEADTAILGNSPFRYVEATHDLEAAHQGKKNFSGK